MDEWNTTDFIVLMDNPFIGESADGRVILHMGYMSEDDDDDVPPVICNFPRGESVVCRLWEGHPGKHIPFSTQLVAVSGVYVRAIDE